MRDRYRYCYEFSKKWQAAGISALICPTWPHCAFKADNAMDMGMMLDYIFPFNIMHYPAAAIPITTVRENEQEYEDSINDGWTKLLKETAKGSEGMPVSVQVVGHSFEDEKVLGILKVIDQHRKLASDRFLRVLE